MSRRVVIAMSGGVDSSVAAALLVEQGYEVIGVTMCLLRGAKERSESQCCSLEAVDDARRVADKLNIRHVVLPMQDEFQQYVIDNFIDEYRHGRTPNPCIRCNQYLKFDALLRHTLSFDAKWIATGHYAKIRYDENARRWMLLRGLDRTKDQSYALYSLTQDQLSHILFPLGEITKKETRERAAELGLAVADKKESQEICFVPYRDYPSYIERVAPDMVKPGPIIDTDGRVLGLHKGIAFYTIGQRKRLGIATGVPKYVVSVDKDNNTVVVGGNEDLMKTRVVAKDLNLISILDIPNSLAVTAKIRYNTKDSEAIIRPMFNNMAEVVFERPVRAVTPGQSVVFYQGEIVVGGGIIVDERESEVG